MDTILLSVQASGRRSELTKAFGDDYDLVSGDLAEDGLSQLPYPDLLVIDLATFREAGAAAIDEYRDREPDVASPVLLLAPRSRLSRLDPAVWEHVDEVIGTPVRPHELNGRVRALLRMRRYAEQAEEARERVSSKYRALFESSALGILLLDDDEIQEANARATDLLGAPLQELAGHTLSSLAPAQQPGGTSSEEKARTLLQEAREEGETWTEWQFAPPDGDLFWVTLMLNRLSLDGNEQLQVAFWDITNHKQTREELKRSRERLANAQRIAGLGSWERDFEEDELYWSEETRRIFGWGSDETITLEKFMNAVHPDDRPALRSQQKRLFKEGTPIDIEYRIERSDGEVRILHEQGEAEFAEDGTLLRLTGTVLDITEQRERERKLRIMSKALEQTTESVLITEGEPLGEPGPKIVYANSAFEEMTGYAEEEVLGETPRILQGPETDRTVLDSLREALEAGESWEGETINYRKDGNSYIVRWTIAPVHDSEGEVEYWVSIQRDVTEQREQEEALRRHRNLLEQTQRLAGAWEVDLQSGDVAWSDEVYRIHELSPSSELDLEQNFEHYPPDARATLRQAFENCVEDGEPYDLELPIVTAEGTHRWVRTVGGPVRGEGGSVVKVTGAFQDVTQRKEAERGLQEREARLRGLANSIPGVVMQFYARPDGTRGNYFVSEHAETLLGISADPDTFTERCMEHVPEAHRERLQTSIERAVENETTWRVEVPFDKPSGERIWILGISTPQRKEDELVFNGVLLDITERKMAEETLREERDRLATLFQNLPTPLVHGHPDDNGRLRIRAVNDAFESVFGYSQREIRGEEIQSLIVPDEERASADSIRRHLLFGEPVDRHVRRETSDGIRDFRVQVALRDGESGPSEGYAIYTDITEERQRQKRQQQQQETLLSLTNDERVIEGDFDAAIREITERAADVLDVPLTSVWLFDDEGRLRCEEYYDRRSGEHSTVPTVEPRAHPPYFEALSQHRVIEVSDLQTDPRIEGLAPEYFQSRNIGAVLDAALRSEGEVIGVVCHEYVGGTREWATDEVQFAGEVADIVHRALRNRERVEQRREMAFQRSLLKTQQEAVLDGMLVVDKERQIVSYNDRFADMWSLPAALREEHDEEEVLNQIIDQVENPETFREKVEHLYEHPEERSREEVQLRDGRVFDRYSTPLVGEDDIHYGRLWTFRDITERKQAERELHETKRRLEKTLESLDEAVLVVDPSERRVVTCNTAVEEVFGYEKSEVIGTNTERLHVDRASYEQFAEVSESALDEEGFFSCEYQMRRKDGRIIDTEHVITSLRGEEWGDGVVSVVRDITDRKERERELQQKERRYQAVFEDPNILVGLLAPDGTTLDINQTALDYVEEDLEAVTGRPFWETPWFSGDEGIQEKIRQWINRAAEGEYLEFTIDLSESVGQPLIVSGNFRPVTNEEGEVTSLLISDRDVTERIQDRRQLERYSEYTERLLNASDDLFFVTDRDGHLQRWNEQVGAVTGYSEKELDGTNVLAFVPEQGRQRAAEKIAEVFQTGRAQMEMPLLTKEDTKIPYEFAANCVEHPDGDLRLVGIGRDVAERKRREEMLVDAKKKAEEAAQLKTAMLANMSHEIRTPLTSIIGFTEMLGQDLVGEKAQFAQKAHSSARRLMKTLDSVLELSKLESGVYELQREVVCLNEVVQETVDLLRAEAEKKMLTLTMHLPEDSVEGRWNEMMLNRIIENLLENAIKFTPEGGRIEIRVRADEEEAILEMEDTGVGIGQEMKSEIFEAFKQESEGLDREYEGSGLGLSIVEKLMDALGGEISVESEKGKGTRFTVALPW